MKQESQHISAPVLVPGQVVEVVVKAAHFAGVAVMASVGGCIVHGTISPRCYGAGRARMVALDAVKSGDVISAIVRSYDARTRSASLVLPGFKDLPRMSTKEKTSTKMVNGSACATRHSRVPKPQFVPEEKGCTFVFDMANVAGELPLACVPNAKVAIEKHFGEFGYSVLFYLDKRAACWLSHVLLSEFAKDKFFADWRANGNASYVGSYRKSGTERKCGESDLAILQTVAALPQSVACSRDGFADYESAFPEVVANRVRQFSVVSLPNGSAVLTVEGAGCGAVIVPPFKGDGLMTK